MVGRIEASQAKPAGTQHDSVIVSEEEAQARAPAKRDGLTERKLKLLTVMPLGRPRVGLSPQSPAGDPRTAVFHADRTTRPPPYRPPTPPKPRSLHVSSDRDLSYFHALANGEYSPRSHTDPPATLALHLFRGTDTHLFPIAERLTLGPATGAPYYAARATPSTLSASEYNTLIVSRRHALRLVSEDLCVAEIRPRLNLFAQGVHDIGKISCRQEEYVVTWSNGTMGPLDGCWCLWQRGRAVAQFYEERGFNGLDEDPAKGIIWVSTLRAISRQVSLTISR